MPMRVAPAPTIIPFTEPKSAARFVPWVAVPVPLKDQRCVSVWAWAGPSGAAQRRRNFRHIEGHAAEKIRKGKGFWGPPGTPCERSGLLPQTPSRAALPDRRSPKLLSPQGPGRS